MDVRTLIVKWKGGSAQWLAARQNLQVSQRIAMLPCAQIRAEVAELADAQDLGTVLAASHRHG
jgi:hypothetical protein